MVRGKFKEEFAYVVIFKGLGFFFLSFTHRLLSWPVTEVERWLRSGNVDDASRRDSMVATFMHQTSRKK
jgi:hypothetical protein